MPPCGEPLENLWTTADGSRQPKPANSRRSVIHSAFVQTALEAPGAGPFEVTGTV